MIYTLVFKSHGHGFFAELEAVLQAAGVRARIVWCKYAPSGLYVPERSREQARAVLHDYWRGLES